MRYLLTLVIFLSGCSWWQAGINDPEVVAEAAKTAATYNTLGEATGIPYAGMVAGVISVVLAVLFGGRKKRRRK